MNNISLVKLIDNSDKIGLDTAIADTGADAIIRAYVSDKIAKGSEQAWFAKYHTSDKDEIAARAGLIEDFLKIDEAAGRLKRIVEKLNEFYSWAYSIWRDKKNFITVTYTWNMFCAYIDAICMLREFISEYPEDSPKSARFAQFCHYVKGIHSDDAVQKAKAIRDNTKYAAVRTVTFGINVDTSFGMEQIGILSVGTEPLGDSGLLSGDWQNAAEGELKSLFPPIQPMDNRGFAETKTFIFDKIWRYMKSELTEISRAVSNAGLNCDIDAEQLASDLRFYTDALEFIASLRGRGYNVCKPSAGQTLSIKGIVPLQLVVDGAETVAANDVHLPYGDTMIITGANGSGKTEYLKAIGQAVLLNSLGWYVAAESAQLPQYDTFYTQFAGGDDTGFGDSKLSTEARQLSKIFRSSTEKSLILLNEPMTGTSAIEAIAICSDMIISARKKGITLAIVTHYREIYETLREYFGEDSRCLVSVVMQHDDAAYVAVEAPPNNASSIAQIKEIAEFTTESMSHDAASIDAAIELLNR